MNLIILFLNLSNNFTIDALSVISLILLTCMLFFHLKINNYSLTFSSFLVFYWLFLWLAPVLQISRFIIEGYFQNTISFDIEIVILALLSVISFNFLFFMSYIFFKKVLPNYKEESSSIKYSSLTFRITTILSVVILLVFMDEYLLMIGENLLKNKMPIFQALIIKKTLFTIVLSSVIFYIVKRKYIRLGSLDVFFFLLAVILLIIFKNPLIEKRNSIGVILLVISFFSFPKMFNSNLKSFLFLSSSLFIVFPLSFFATHWRSISEKQSFTLDVIFENFYQLHYDAFSNIIASINYVSAHGITYGNQLLGGLLFFIPRSVWDGKPLNSGKMIGQYLMQKHNMWFDTLSLPFIGESILNFGPLGIVLFAFFLSIIVCFFEMIYFSKDFLVKSVSVYFSFHLIFLLRGDFTNAFAYFAGTVIGFYVIPKLINKLFKIRFY